MPHTLARRPKWKFFYFFIFFKSRVCPCQRPPYEMEDPAREFCFFFKKGSGSLYLNTYSDQVKQIIVIRPRFLLPVEEEDNEQREKFSPMSE